MPRNAAGNELEADRNLPLLGDRGNALRDSVVDPVRSKYACHQLVLATRSWRRGVRGLAGQILTEGVKPLEEGADLASVTASGSSHC